MDDAARTRLVAAITAHRANGGAVLLASHFALDIPDLAELDMGARA
jgi:heme exporter protein A